MQHYCEVPVSYCWSPALLPCPADWPSNAEVVGFCQLEASQGMQYQPPEDLKRFLAAGTRPVYVGFGSMTLSKAKVSCKDCPVGIPSLVGDDLQRFSSLHPLGILISTVHCKTLACNHKETPSGWCLKECTQHGEVACRR